jgi:creatinine amidohydrolase
METKMKPRKFGQIVIVLGILAGATLFSLEAATKALVLQEMSWKDVEEYLKTSDMVIIPLGSTEQHGPHLPLGTDFYEAFGLSKLISERTGVLVAPVVLVGYSPYHSGFPGTISLRPETLEQVLFEAVEWLLKYGFRRFLFFNYHGGNNAIQTKLIYRVNQSTEGIAIAIGHGGPILKEEEEEGMDWHAGVSETSKMLFLQPQLVRMDRAQKPVMHFSPQVEELRRLAAKDPSLENVWNALLGVPVETRKGGASHEISSNGIWSLRDPKEASAEKGQKSVENMVKQAVNFINAWKKATVKGASPN